MAAQNAQVAAGGLDVVVNLRQTALFADLPEADLQRLAQPALAPSCPAPEG